MLSKHSSFERPETRDPHMIAECVLNEAQAPGLRADLEARLDHSLIVGIAWAEHHPVLAKSDRPPVAIGRDVPDGQCRCCLLRPFAAVNENRRPQFGRNAAKQRGRL